MIIGKGTGANVNNRVTIALDKVVLADLDCNRPKGGYPPAQEQAIQDLRIRIADFESKTKK